MREPRITLQQVLDRLPVGAYLCDAAGLITYCNPAAVELWGRAPALRDPKDRWCGSFKLYLPDGTPLRHDQCWMARAIHENRAYVGEEIVIERPDGRRIQGLAHANPLHDERGRILGAVNVLVDVSERRLGEEAREHLAAIVENSHDAIVSKTLDGTITSWNRAAELLFGYPAVEAVGQPITMIIPPERLSEEADILRRLRRGERIDSYETQRLRKDGGIVDVALTISPLRDAHGRIVGASKIARDIGERKAEERRKDEFLMIVAHELRNPLAPLINSLDLLQAGAAEPATRDELLSIAHRQAGHLARLVEELMEASRIGRGVIELRRAPVAVAEVLERAVEISQPLVSSRSQKLEVAFPDAMLTVSGDRTRVIQIVANLLNNAAKYTPRGGRIELSAHRDNGTAVIRVADDGIGIPPEMIPRMFEMFMQLDTSPERTYGGLGIGLSLVRRLVELHGGTVEARSEGRGRGSEFVVRLPALQLALPAPAAQPRARPH